jgi:hypothetical protein
MSSRNFAFIGLVALAAAQKGTILMSSQGDIFIESRQGLPQALTFPRLGGNFGLGMARKTKVQISLADNPNASGRTVTANEYGKFIRAALSTGGRAKANSCRWAP